MVAGAGAAATAQPRTTVVATGLEAPWEYLLLSNRDVRGDPAPNDDRIIRLVPPR